MGCACSKRTKPQRYLWYKDEAEEPKVYSLIEAKAKVHRRGGRYIPYNPNVDIGVQIADAEATRTAAGG